MRALAAAVIAVAAFVAATSCAGRHRAAPAMSETVLTPRGAAPITDRAVIIDRLAAAGVVLRAWPERLPAEFVGKDLAPADQQKILAIFQPRIDALKTERGYVAQDVIALRASNPKLDEIMAKFNRCHTHSDDEVRAILDGHGVFTIFPEHAPALELRVAAGDLLIIPAGTRHLFNLAEDRSIAAIRLYKDKAGWAANYCDPPAYAK